jgi:hypothetical protein
MANVHVEPTVVEELEIPLEVGAVPSVKVKFAMLDAAQLLVVSLA